MGGGRSVNIKDSLYNQLLHICVNTFSENKCLFSEALKMKEIWYMGQTGKMKMFSRTISSQYKLENWYSVNRIVMSI